MKAVNNYIIITTIKEEQKTEGGFIMQDDKAEFRYLKGEVVSVGEKTEAIKCCDIIYYDRHSGHDIMLDGKSYTVIRQQDVVIVE
uniref:Co-chaperonin GroES n=1 Tax=uncultured virus TaxID=340016 RepID=A0A221S2Q5_9VIRU|nr:co-chaperonin GroES [uncultured virus]